MDCKNCNVVPMITVESIIAKNERIEKKHFIVELILIILLVVSNIVWFGYARQFQKVTTNTTELENTINQESVSGANYYIGGDLNGEADN